MARKRIKTKQQLSAGLHQLIEAQALRTPHRIAITYKNHSLSYAELSRKSSLFSKHLQRIGVQPGDLIGVNLPTSVDLIVALLGILKAQGAYVPLDPNFPSNRLEYMVQDSQSKFIVTHSMFKEKIKHWRTQPQQLVYIDDHSWQINKKRDKYIEKLEEDFDPESLAYVIYTSGSTGNPKGVMITHHSLINFLSSMVRKLKVNDEDKFLAVTTYCFDIAGLEMFMPLLTGARCFLCESKIAKNADKLKEIIARIKPTMMQATPSTWSMLFQIGWQNTENMHILCGGELLTEALKQAFLQTTKNIWNLYGPTETTIWSTIKKIGKNVSPANIGKPIDNTEILILDNNYRQVADGEKGEICIGGEGLAKGYYNHPELTTDKFINHPTHPGKKIYRTGDLGRVLDNGDIEFLGRMDHQVKVRGYRIELEEIESCLNKNPTIKESVVVVKEQKAHKQLVAYVTTYNKKDYSSQKLKNHLMENLPEYMVPSFFIHLDNLPLTPNLKVDRKYLAELKVDLILEEEENLQNQSILENRLIDIWQKVLNINFNDINASFFDIGGDSVLATSLAEEINKKLDFNVSVTDIFKYQNIKSICDYILKGSKNSLSNKVSKKDIFEENHYHSHINPNDMAIVGMVGSFPMAENLDIFWKNIIEGKNCISEVPMERWKWQDVFGDSKKEKDKTEVKWGGFIKGIKEFDSLFFNISPHEAILMDPQQRLLLTYTWLALENAGISAELFSKKSTGVFIAAGPNDYYDSLLNTEPNNNPYLITSNTLSMIPNRISYYFNFQGPSEIFEATCSSSLVALHRAIQSIQLEECEQAVVGAINLLLSPKKTIAYDAMGILSHDRNIFSFQENAKGYLRSECIAVCIIKPLENAIKDEDIIFSVIKGTSIYHGGHGISLTAPNQSGIETTMIQAYRKANIDSRTVAYIETHGTASPIGDNIEIEAIKSAYQVTCSDNQQYNYPTHNCYLSSLKPCIGHSEIASGMASLFKAVMAIRHKLIPGIPNFQHINEKISLLETPFKISSNNQQWEIEYDQNGNILPRRASINSYGFGVNAHVVIEEYVPLENSYNKNDTIELTQELIILSAKTDDRLIIMIRNLLQFIDANPFLSISNIAYTLQIGRVHMNKRFACTVSSMEELKKSLIKALNSQNFSNEFTASINENLAIPNLHNNSQTEIEIALKERDLNYLAKIWIKGAKIDWQNLTRKNSPNKVVLPSYPFYKHQYWLSKTIESTSNVEANQEKCKADIHLEKKKRICIIGAGPSGLVMAKSLLEEGHIPVIYEKQDRLGGIWNLKKDKICGVYKKTRFQNSKDTSFFSDFYPHSCQDIFLAQQEVREYLDQYSEKFNLLNIINFDSQVLSVRKNEQSSWEVEILDSNERTLEYFDGVALCHGRYSIPFIPTLPGLSTFKGEILHSGQYYDNSIFKNKKVLIIGNGVSGMDIAEDAVETANEVIWCMRTVRLILPRMVGFLPNDYVSPANLLISGNNSGILERLKDSVPDYYEAYQQSRLFPKKEDFEEYPFIHINDNIVKLVASGKIKTIIGEINRIETNGCLIQGTEELINDIDIIVFCTGYDNDKNFDYVKNISIQNDFSMGLFYNKDPTLVNSYGLNDVGTTGTFPYLEMVARWYAQIISNKYQLDNEEINHRVDPKDIIVAPIANVIMGLKLGLLPDPKKYFKEFWKLLKYPSFTMIYRLIGPHLNSDVYDTLTECTKRAMIPDEEDDPQLKVCKYRILAGLGKACLKFLLENKEITEEDFNHALHYFQNPIILNWDSQYIKRKSINTVSQTQSIKENEVLLLENEKFSKLDASQFHKILSELVAETVKIEVHNIDMDDNLSSYGLSSVTLTLLADKISAAFPTIKLIPATFIEHPTFGKLSSYLFNKYYSSVTYQETTPKIQTLPDSPQQIDTRPLKQEIPHQQIGQFDSNDIAIIGIGGRFPNSDSLIDFWKKLINNESFVTEIPDDRWDWQHYYGNPNEDNKTDCHYGSFIKNVDSFDNDLFNIPAEEAKLIDPQHRLMLEAIWETLENAGYSKNSLEGKKIGCFIGVERQDYLHLLKENGYPIGGISI